MAYWGAVYCCVAVVKRRLGTPLSLAGSRHSVEYDGIIPGRLIVYVRLSLLSRFPLLLAVSTSGCVVIYG